MDRSTIFKIALGGIGAYLLYQFAKGRGWIGGSVYHPTDPPGSFTIPARPVTTVPAAQTAPAPANPASAAANAGAIAAGTAATAAQNLDPVAAARDASYAATSPLSFTPDEWNYYRDQAGLPIRDALEYPGITSENRGSVRISGAQYHAWVSGGMGAFSSMSGIGALGGFVWRA